MFPLRRASDLIVREVAGETLVYDKQRDKSHCLNPTAAFIWKHCDGKTTIQEMAALLPAALSLPADAGVIQLGLNRLEKRHLLQARTTPRMAEARASRRDLMRKFGIAAVALPVVMTIFAPTAAAAASSTTSAMCSQCV